MIICIMGVAGSGKSTIGKMVAEKLNLTFLDADDFHPQSNIEKMKKGNPLNDEDRLPWLQILNRELHERNKGRGAILACSALKNAYRKILEEDLEIFWVHLDGSLETLIKRMENRKDHFMPVSLLKSQKDTLEASDNALVVDIENSPDLIVEKILGNLPED